MEGLDFLLKALAFLIYIIGGGLATAGFLIIFGFFPICFHKQIFIFTGMTKEEAITKYGLSLDLSEDEEGSAE